MKQIMKALQPYKLTGNYILYSMMLTFIPSVILFVAFTMWHNLGITGEDSFSIMLSAMMAVLLPILFLGGTAIVFALPELLVFWVTKIIQKPVTYIELDSRMDDLAKLVRWGFATIGLGFCANALLPVLLGMYWGAFGLLLVGLVLPLVGYFTYNRMFHLVDSFDYKKRRKRGTRLNRATA